MNWGGTGNVLCSRLRISKTEGGETKNFMAANVLQDFQRTHSGHTTITAKKIGQKVSAKLFNLSNLQDTY